MKIIVISSSADVDNEHTIITKLFESGLETFHIRKPKYSTRELRDYIRKIPAHFHNRLVIHSHHSLALKFPLKGIHITRVHNKRKFKLWLTTKILKMKRPGIVMSTSFRKLANLYEEPAGNYSYVFLSPIFDSLSGKFQSGFSEQSLRIAIEKTGHRVIARGGVSIDKSDKIESIGFAGIAFYSVIWKSEDPLKEFLKILEFMQEKKIVRE